MTASHRRQPRGLNRLRASGPFLILPLLTFSALLVSAAPDLWKVAFVWLKGMCLSTVNDVSGESILLATLGLTTSAIICAGLIVLIREFRRLQSLSKRIATSSLTVHDSWIMVNDPKPYAFCHGLLNPRVYLSTGLSTLLDEEEFKAVCIHERVHLQRRDPLRVLIVHVLTGALFFLPLARLIRDRYLLRMELDADRQVIKKLGQPALARALIKLLQPVPSQKMELAPYFNPTEERVKQLLQADSSVAALVPMRQVLASSVLVATVSVFTGIGAYGTDFLLKTAPFCRLPLT